VRVPDRTVPKLNFDFAQNVPLKSRHDNLLVKRGNIATGITTLANFYRSSGAHRVVNTVLDKLSPFPEGEEYDLLRKGRHKFVQNMYTHLSSDPRESYEPHIPVDFLSPSPRTKLQRFSDQLPKDSKTTKVVTRFGRRLPDLN